MIRRHQEFVVQAAGRAQNDRENEAKDPFIARADAFFPPGGAQKKVGHDGQADADPLQQIQPFPEQEEGADEHQDRTGGIDRTHDRQRQMFHREISRHPGREHQGALHQDILLHFPTAKAGREQEGRKDDGGEYGVQEKNRNHGVPLQRNLLRRVIAA